MYFEIGDFVFDHAYYLDHGEKRWYSAITEEFIDEDIYLKLRQGDGFSASDYLAVPRFDESEFLKRFVTEAGLDNFVRREYGEVATAARLVHDLDWVYELPYSQKLIKAKQEFYAEWFTANGIKFTTKVKPKEEDSDPRKRGRIDNPGAGGGPPLD